MEISNFGANVRIKPVDYFEPRTEKEVLEILDRNRGRRIRVIARLHSWSEAPSGEDVVLNLKNLNEVRIEQRADENWAIIQAGCQIKHIVSELQERGGLTLPSLGLITEQAIAGAASTGTHGSGKHSLSHYVDEVTIACYDSATGKAQVQTISDGPELQAARCSLGCTGVILSVGVRCRSQYNIEQQFRFYRELDSLIAAEEQYPLQQFYLMPFSWTLLAQHRYETEKSTSLLAPLFRLYWFLSIDLSLHLVLLTLKRLIRSRGLIRFFYRRIVPLTIIRGWKVTDRSQHLLTMEHELFRHIEIEMFVRRSQLKPTLDFVKQLLMHCDGQENAISDETWDKLDRIDLKDDVQSLRGSYSHHYPICVRKVLADATLISMASSDSEPYYAVSCISYDRPDERQGFFSFARVLALATGHLFEARPHWGKHCPIDSEMIEQLYPKLKEFKSICDQLDPDGLFRNAWLDRTLFGASKDDPVVGTAER